MGFKHSKRWALNDPYTKIIFQSIVHTLSNNGTCSKPPFQIIQSTLLMGPYNGHLLGFMALTDDKILLDKDVLLCHQTISVKHNNSFTEKLHVFTVYKLRCLTVKVHKLYDKILTPCVSIFCPSLSKTDTQQWWSTPVFSMCCCHERTSEAVAVVVKVSNI